MVTIKHLLMIITIAMIFIISIMHDQMSFNKPVCKKRIRLPLNLDGFLFISLTIPRAALPVYVGSRNMPVDPATCEIKSAGIKMC